MRCGTIGTRTGRGAAVVGAALGLYLAVVRPRMVRWGAADDEVAAEYPTRELVAGPRGRW